MGFLFCGTHCIEAESLRLYSLNMRPHYTGAEAIATEFVTLYRGRSFLAIVFATEFGHIYIEAESSLRVYSLINLATLYNAYQKKK